MCCATCERDRSVGGAADGGVRARAVSLQHVGALYQQAQAALVKRRPGLQQAMGAAGGGGGGAAGAMAAAAPPGVGNHLILSDTGDPLVASSAAQGNSGDVVLQGTILGLPYELHLNVSLNGTRVTVRLEMVKPIPLPPVQWDFDLTGIVSDAGGVIRGATGVVASAGSNPVAALAAGGGAGGGMSAQGLGWLWCAAKCGGATIAPTLLECLPSLAGGPEAYVACVVAKVGMADAATIAMCIAKNCT